MVISLISLPSLCCGRCHLFSAVSKSYMTWGPQNCHVPSRVSFQPVLRSPTSRGLCTRGPRRQEKSEGEGAGLPALKLKEGTRGWLHSRSGEERHVCRGVKCCSWLAGVGGVLSAPRHLTGPPPLYASCWNFHVLRQLPPQPQSLKQSTFLLEAICENNGLYLKNKLSCNTRKDHCDYTSHPPRWG